MSNKTSDKNVANIEIVIKDCREHLKLYGEAFITASELDRIENILAEREQKDKRIQELEEESRKKSIELICYQEELENSIPKQVVIDKIDELGISDEDINIRYVLQELLEGEKNRNEYRKTN